MRLDMRRMGKHVQHACGHEAHPMFVYEQSQVPREAAGMT